MKDEEKEQVNYGLDKMWGHWRQKKKWMLLLNSPMQFFVIRFKEESLFFKLLRHFVVTSEYQIRIILQWSNEESESIKEMNKKCSKFIELSGSLFTYFISLSNL